MSDYEVLNLDTVIDKLPSKLSEISGIIKLDSIFWTHNDNGDKPILYSFNPKAGNIFREVYIQRGQYSL